MTPGFLRFEVVRTQTLAAQASMTQLQLQVGKMLLANSIAAKAGHPLPYTHAHYEQAEAALGRFSVHFDALSSALVAMGEEVAVEYEELIAERNALEQAVHKLTEMEGSSQAVHTEEFGHKFHSRRIREILNTPRADKVYYSIKLAYTFLKQDVVTVEELLTFGGMTPAEVLESLMAHPKEFIQEDALRWRFVRQATTERTPEDVANSPDPEKP